MSPGVRPRVPAPLLVVAALAIAPRCAAQTPVELHLDSVIYIDNTEFNGPFRSGETIPGSFQELFFDIAPTRRTVLRLGVFAIEQAGASSAVDHALPIVALRWGNGRHRFVLGTIDSADRRHPRGPDRETPHGLLPPLASETRWFTHAYEAGAQWFVDTSRQQQDIWFDYQVANTRDHREKFDTGAVGRLHLGGPLSAAYQFHVVHHGGQQFDAGPVSDSFALGPGVVLRGPVGALQAVSLEIYGLGAYDRADRTVASAVVKGKAAFLRAGFEMGPWRAHLVVWRGDNFNHEDGDANYLSRFPDGRRFTRVRDYGEAGLTRLFRLTPGIDFEGSFRLHRIESNYAYSYRLVAIAHLALWKTTLP